jgi:hypothetical protein
MLYELSSPGDGQSLEQQQEKLRAESKRYLAMAYDGLVDAGSGGARFDGVRFARIAIGLRTPDYGDRLPAMLKALEDANAGDPYYLGWARHSYNDMLASH